MHSAKSTAKRKEGKADEGLKIWDYSEEFCPVFSTKKVKVLGQGRQRFYGKKGIDFIVKILKEGRYKSYICRLLEATRADSGEQHVQTPEEENEN